MTDGHRTTSIPRPSDATRSRRAPEIAATGDGTRFGDLTRPISAEKRVVQGRGKRLLVAGAAALIAGSLAAALFVLPVKAWMRQRVEIERKQEQLAVINAANAQLITDVNKLQTDDGIKEAARQNIGYVERGEVRISILSEPAAPLTLPTGWPYDAVAQVVSVRSGTVVAAPPAAPADTPSVATVLVPVAPVATVLVPVAPVATVLVPEATVLVPEATVLVTVAPVATVLVPEATVLVTVAP